MKTEEAKSVIDRDMVSVAFIFQTVYGIPLEVFNEWNRDISYLTMAYKCAYWRKKMPLYFEPIPWKN